MARMSDEELNKLHETVAEGIKTLEQQSEEFRGHARILWCGLAIELDEEETLDHLVGMAAFAQDQAQKVIASDTPDPGIIVH